jgi:hypothetical protein
MPYNIRKDGNSYLLVNQMTHEVKSRHDSEEKAKAAIRAIYANTHEPKLDPKKKKSEI